MAVIDADLVWTLAASGASEGGAQTATVIPDNVDENLFEDVSDTTRIAGWTEIRKLYLGNENGVDSLPPHSLWELATPTGCTTSIGLGVNSADDADPAAGTLVDFSAPAQVALASNGADTRTVRLRGKNADGDPITEDVVLTGASEVLSVATFSSLYLGAADAVSASRTVTIKEGSAGTTRGTIAVNQLCCFRWITGATSKSTGIHLAAMATGGEIPIWARIVGPADVAAGARTLSLRVQTL
jgi:hypothetical protein